MDYFKINVVTELEKENPFPNAYICRKKLKSKYSLNDRECSRVYVNIVRYQVQKYGTNLAGSFSKEKKIRRTDNIYKITKRRR